MFIQTYRRPAPAMLIAAMLASALVTAGSAAAQADDPGAARRVSFKYSDLDLGREDGARAMLGRIKSASSRACGGQRDIRLLDQRMIYEKCFNETVARSVTQLNAPLVTAMAKPAQATSLARR